MMAESAMQFGYVVVFVPDVEETVAFYERAFGCRRGMVAQMFGQLQTGGTSLAFGAEANEERELPDGFRYHKNRAADAASGTQLSFVTDNVSAAFQKAVANGCVSVVEPKRQPWGQTVSRVRDLNGVLVSIVSPFAPPQP